jgi:hypothetical protein
MHANCPSQRSGTVPITVPILGSYSGFQMKSTWDARRLPISTIRWADAIHRSSQPSLMQVKKGKRTARRPSMDTNVVEYCLLTVWPVRGSFLPGDLALASPMSIHLMTHLVTSEVSSHSRCTVASTRAYEYSGSRPAPNTSRTLLQPRPNT